MKRILVLGLASIVLAACAPSNTTSTKTEHNADKPTANESVAEGHKEAPSNDSAEPAKPADGDPQKVDCAAVKCVALTYDDGPGTRTKELADTLTKLKAPATFFMLGNQVSANPKTAKAVADNPLFEVASHTVTHPDLTKRPESDVRNEVIGGQQKVEKATGKKVTLFRPPYGATNKMVKAVAAEGNMSVIMWNVDTMDWKTRSTSETVKAAVETSQPGSIVLMHDIHGSSVDAAPAIVEGLRKRGFTLVTVSTLLKDPKPGVSYNGRS